MKAALILWYADLCFLPAREANPAFYRRSQEFFDEAQKQALHQTEFASSRRCVIHKSLVAETQKISDGNLHFMFINSDHFYEGYKTDVNDRLTEIPPAEILCGELYSAQVFKRSIKRAVDEFTSQGGKDWTRTVIIRVFIVLLIEIGEPINKVFGIPV